MARGTIGNGVHEVLTALEPRSRTLALLLLVADSIFGVSIFAAGAASSLSDRAFEVAVIGVVVVLLASMAAITVIELTVERNTRPPTLEAITETTPSEVLDRLVNSTLEMICRATSLPLAPDEAQVRAFIFKREDDELVCKYYWALNPTSEKVGITRFPLTHEVSQDVAVVRCALDRKITRTAVAPLPTEVQEAASDSVEDDLTFVLAAPILDQDHKVWGTVDFDTTNELGKARLSTRLADTAIFQLSSHLQTMFALRVDGANAAPRKS